MVSAFSSPPTAHQPTPPRTLSPYISLLNQSYFTFWYDVRHGPYTQPLGFRVVHSASPHRWCFLPMLGMRPSHVFSPIIVFLIMSSKYIKLSGLSTYVFADHLLPVLVWIPGLKYCYVPSHLKSSPGGILLPQKKLVSSWCKWWWYKMTVENQAISSDTHPLFLPWLRP